MHESKFPFVSRIKFIRSKLSNFPAHVSGVTDLDDDEDDEDHSPSPQRVHEDLVQSVAVSIPAAALRVMRLSNVLDISLIARVAVHVVRHHLFTAVRKIDRVRALGAVSEPVLLRVDVDARVGVLDGVRCAVVGHGVVVDVLVVVITGGSRNGNQGSKDEHLPKW